jgi:nucleoside-diphosphate-sugar epimerase
MKTLVTGGTGFIGRHLVKALVEGGRDVKCLIRKTSQNNNLENLAVELACGDLLDKDSLNNAVSGVNIIYHLGGEVYSPKVKDYYKINVQGTKNLLEACLSHRIEKFIYFSSIAAAGPNPNRCKLLSEEDACNPITPYGKSKLEAELSVRNFSNTYGFSAAILRLPIVYGPGQSGDVTRIFEMIKRGHFIYFGNGENIKSLCHIKNVIYGSILVEAYKESMSEIFYLADDHPHTIKEIVQTIAEKEGVKLSCSYLPKFLADGVWSMYKLFTALFGISLMSLYVPKSLSLDFGCSISRAKEKLSYQPVIKFDEGIEDTVNWLSNANPNFRNNCW